MADKDFVTRDWELAWFKTHYFHAQVEDSYQVPAALACLLRKVAKFVAKHDILEPDLKVQVFLDDCPRVSIIVSWENA